MPFNVVVDVTVGLVVLFWVVATTASFVVEAITSFVNLRGRALEMFVREMLVATGAKQTLREALTWFPRTACQERPAAALPATGAVGIGDLDVTDHPLIRRLAKPATFISGPDTSPSYIPADLFAKALLDRLHQLFGGLLAAADALRAVHAALPQPLRLKTEVPLHKALSKLGCIAAWSDLLKEIAADADNRQQRLDDTLQELPDGPARLALGVVAVRLKTPDDWAALLANPTAFVTGLWQEVEAAAGSRLPSVADLRAIVGSGLLPAPLAVTLRPLLDAANHDIETFRKGLEGWYDSVMDRASGWFRRYAQFMLFVAAFVMAALLNLDTLSIGRRLFADPLARGAAVRAGEMIVRQGDDAPTLVQTYAFSATFRDGQWATPLNVGMSRLQAAEAVALRAQPLLLKSGSLVGPMLALQAAALRAEGHCIGRTDGDCTPAEIAKHWTQQADAQNPLIAALCRASLKRPEDLAWAAALSDAELLKQIPDPAKGVGRCKTQLGLVRAEGKGALQALDGLWASDQVVWNPALGSAAWDVRKASAPGAAPSQPDEIAAVFSTAMGNAVAAAKLKVEAADELLSRLPEVGWLGFRDSWKASSGCDWALAIFLSLIGWWITAFMASLGAPLWFDLLNKLVNRRIAGPKPEPAAMAGP